MAVIRTLTSPDEARYATVGLEDVRNRSSSISATFDSAMPVARIVRDTRAARPASPASSGRMVPLIISRISAGTPGTA